MQRCKVRDFYPLSSSRQYTAEGFLVAPAKINRTGVQVYTARELGLDGGDEKRFRLYRSPTEVFRKETLDSFENQTATDDHPPEDVSAENWHIFAKGEVRDIAADGQYTAANLLVKAADLISKVRDGKVEISCGYAFDLDMTPGTTPEGEEFDGRQTNIVGNHVAIVDYGRAGSSVRIGDRDPNRSNRMKTKISTKDHKINDKLTVPGQSLTIEADDAVVAAVQDLADRHDRAMKDCKDAYDSKHAEMLIHKERADAAEKAMRDSAKMKDDEEDPDDDDDEDEDKPVDKKKAGDRLVRIKTKLDAKLAAKDAEIARLTTLTSPAEQEKRAEERAKVIADAKPLLAEDFEAKGKTVPQIRQAALDAALKDENLAGMVKAMLGGVEPSKAKEDVATRAFDALVARPGATRVDDQDPDLSAALLNTNHDAPLGAGFAPGSVGAVSGRDSFYAREAAMSRLPASGAGANDRGARDYRGVTD